MRRVGLAPLAAVVTLVLLLAWTWLTLRTRALAPLDTPVVLPGLTPSSRSGQILAAMALVTTPLIVYTALAGLTWWSARRRLHRLAWAIAASIPLGWGSSTLLKMVFRRPRPEDALPLITAEGWAYPSAHMVAATIGVVMLLAAMVLTRRARTIIVAAAVALAVAWWAIALNRVFLHAHWFTDVIGGGFLGGFVASACLAAAGVRVVRLPDLRRPAMSSEPLRPAIVLNPTKIPDLVVFRRHVVGECVQRGWSPPLWLETDPEDHGAGAARAARRRKADLVLVAGGDGTVRTVLAGLAGADVPVAILPVGTGNLLARNLGVPLDLAAALDLAFDGTPRPLDLIELRADGGEVQHSVVMAGMGADALIMSETNPDLKKVVGPAAYVMAALQTLGGSPFSARVGLDGGSPVARTPSLALIANVGQLQGQFPIVPDAVPDDGLLDLLLASPRRTTDWAAMATRVLVRAPDADGVERAQVRSVVIETEEPVPFQIDGDSAGTCTRLEASVAPAVVHVMAP